jgi:hypothetical protein
MKFARTRDAPTVKEAKKKEQTTVEQKTKDESEDDDVFAFPGGSTQPRDTTPARAVQSASNRTTTTLPADDADEEWLPTSMKGASASSHKRKRSRS